jgi:hypothetical protein
MSQQFSYQSYRYEYRQDSKLRSRGPELIVSIKACHVGLIRSLLLSNPTLNLLKRNYRMEPWRGGRMETKRAYKGRDNSQSGDWSRILPRCFTRARVRCHSLMRRLAVKTVMFAASANS